jgi:hypothetical protein
MKKNISTEKDISNYFQHHVSRALKANHIEISQTSKIYLINLLSEFIKSRRAFHLQNEDDGPLAVIFLQAFAKDINEQIKIFRDLGDFSLFITGFFPDSFNKKIVDIDYYIGIGSNAYNTLSSIFTRFYPQNDIYPLYQELADKFVSLVNILSDISEEGAVKFNEGLLRTYERWMKTGSIRDKKLLVQHGVIPNADISTEFMQ